MTQEQRHRHRRCRNGPESQECRAQGSGSGCRGGTRWLVQGSQWLRGEGTGGDTQAEPRHRRPRGRSPCSEEGAARSTNETLREEEENSKGNHVRGPSVRTRGRGPRVPRRLRRPHSRACRGLFSERRQGRALYPGVSSPTLNNQSCTQATSRRT